MYIATPFPTLRSPPDDASSVANHQMQRVLHDLRSLVGERKSRLATQSRAQSSTLLSLALAAECRDGETGVHIVRLGQIAGLLAEALTGDRALAEQLCQAAPMHDIGKIGIPDAVLKKPGPLDEGEWAVMRQHPEIGARILGGSAEPLFALATKIARHHHEKFDGTGYPDALAGTGIPPSARIVAVADFYDALTMDRVYRARLPHDAVLELISAQSGRHFDPTVVAAFLLNAERIDQLRLEVNRRFEKLSLEEAGIDAFAPMF